MHFFEEKWLLYTLLNTSRDLAPPSRKCPGERTIVVLCSEASARSELSSRLHEHKALP